MATFAPASRCDVAWCRSWHRPADLPGHAARIAVWRLDGYEVEVFIGQAPECQPVVRLNRIDDEHGHRARDLDPELSSELADILDALPGRTRELIAALRTAGEALAP